MHYPGPFQLIDNVREVNRTFCLYTANNEAQHDILRIIAIIIICW